MSNIQVFIVDTEVFAFDYLADFKEKETGEHFSFYNDPEAIAEMLEKQDCIFATFNGKHYDRFILSAIVRDGRPEIVKQVNDFIISGNNGWEYPDRSIVDYYFPMYDLMDDMQQGLSLKAIEGHLGMNICESTVPFNLDRPLTDEERKEVLFYCQHDVDATDKLDDLRQNYLKNKITLGNEKGIRPANALYMTNAKLTAGFLGAIAKEYDDEREYKYPQTLNLEYIPKEVTEFFNRLSDKSISNEQIFSEKLDITVGDCPCTIGYGGIHGAIPCYRETATETRTIRNKDVASYYPHQMVLNGYCSRSIPSPDVYAQTIERRVKAKKSGDKATANALKLVLNTTYGAMLNAYNPLCDPLMGRSVCISGQLQLLELGEHLVKDCRTLRLIQLNTDGIMVSLDNSDVAKYEEITQEWQDRTGFELEEDFIKTIAQKDVNNYVEIPLEGEPKIKGGVLVRGISPAGAFNINNNAKIVAKAVKDYFVNGTPPETTIAECNNTLDFQFISKASSKYSACYHEIDGQLTETQKVNRVYAVNDYRYGTLYKKHKETGTIAKISSLPLCCKVDNNNQIKITEIDKDWYVRLANRYIADFIGNEAPKANKREINKIQKQIIKILESDYGNNE